MKTLEDIYSKILGITGVDYLDKSEVPTPRDTVDNMVEMVWEQMQGKITPETTFLDIACKSGRYLVALYEKLFNCPELSHLSTDDRHKNIVEKQLYGLTFSSAAATVARKSIYGNPKIAGNIHYVEGYIAKVKDNKIQTDLDRIFGDHMKFDVTVGNPPYNNDVYLDFVTLGHKLAKQYTCMITPAKWQAKSGKKNEDFRKNIVPYMSKIVFYPVAGDIFDIAEPGGVSYYLIDKVKTGVQICTISNCEALNCEFEEHNEHPILLYRLHVCNIVEKCSQCKSIVNKLKTKGNGSSFLRSFYLHESFKTLQTIPEGARSIGCYSGSNNVGYVSKDELYTIDFLDKWKITQTVMLSAGVWAKIPNYGTNPLNKIRPNEVPIGSYPIIAVFNTEKEADSFISYVSCKLVKFLHYIGINATTETSEFWRFIPDPGAFDHIFTDQELYQKYGLTDDEIKIIESVIKERK